MSEPFDLRGLKCPLPALMTRKAMTGLTPGTLLVVLADDPMAAVDIPHMCHGEGHFIESVTVREDVREFAIRSGSASAPLPDRYGR